MKKNRVTCIFLSSFLFCLSSCGQDDYDNAPVTIEYRLLNGDKEPATAFSVGENFVFSLQITNNSDRTIYLMQERINTANFFEVFSATQQDENGNPISFGKPYDYIFLVKVNGMGIHPGETLKLEIPWAAEPWEIGSPHYSAAFFVENVKEPLSEGNYLTDFSTSFEFSSDGKSNITDSKNFTIHFSIE